MKKLLIFLFLSNILITNAMEQKEPKQDYRTEKAFEAIIYDTYREAQPIKNEELPESYEKILTQFGLTKDDVHFYTATRMNRFVEKVGNNVILLRPNFFLYLTEAEQLSHIAVQLQKINSNDNSEIGDKYNPTKQLLTQFKKISTATTGLLLAALYHKEITNGISYYAPTIKSAILSKAGVLIGTYAAANLLAKALYQQQEIRNAREHEFSALDITGAQDWISVKEKQINWGKNNYSRITYQWYKLLGKFDLAYNPETQLEAYKEHLKQKDQK